LGFVEQHAQATLLESGSSIDRAIEILIDKGISLSFVFFFKSLLT
jgi:hypothetical protein